MYRWAYKYSDDVIFYFDSAGNKYVASGGSLAWRINNPGLVSTHSHFSRNQGAVGCCGRYAIFSNPLDGHTALSAWMHSKKYYNSSLKTIAAHYQPKDPEAFLSRICSLTKIPPEAKVNSLNAQQFDHLLRIIEKLCGYTNSDNQSFLRLPKIIGKIENGKDRADTYLIEDNSVLSKEEAIHQILSHCLDAVIVHKQNGAVHLRSRPYHCIWTLKMHESMLPSEQQFQIDTIIRKVGEHKQRQCIWAFINGIDNTKDEALESADLISKAAGDEQVLSMQNDTNWAPIDFLHCIALKTTLDTSMVEFTVKFLRYLLATAKQSNHMLPIIVFVHSQGAIYIEHAIEHLSLQERMLLRIFTFGGGSFLAPGKVHPDSHNFASVADFVCLLTSPNLQLLALERYYSFKEGLNESQVISQLALRDAMLYLDSVDINVVKTFVKKRVKYYENEFSHISNLTILDPDPDSNWKHELNSACYQQAIQTIIKKYQCR